ncbi:site-2 protease family protein [Allosphingosinicella sp.]|uniref:site-2 protease family protein n=1 Tax=Allosphingosinicella sp. TaxID=2823234 RepID=UPI002F0EA4D5
MNGAGAADDNLIFRIATLLIPLVVAIVLHEISHGWVANAFGDPTAKRLGRLSPNPVRHVDPVGTLALPLMLAIAGLPVFGWAKPVPVIAQRMRNPRVHMMIVALAGPAMNLLLALVAAFALAFAHAAWASDSSAYEFLIVNLSNFLVINVFLAVFNLLPIPPFDGGHVVEGLLPRPMAKRYVSVAHYGFPVLIFLLVVLPLIAPEANIVERVVVPPVAWLIGLLVSLAGIG